jgi:enoyl-CoA hydratase/carnithine racemase
VQPDELEQRVHELAELMATERSHLTQVATKEMVAEVLATGSVSPALAQRWAEAVSNSGEDSEGVNAFLEKRAPRFPFMR